MISEQGRSIPKRKRRWLASAVAAFVVALTLVVLWLGDFVPVPDPLFRGKPESVWMTELKYNDNEQVNQWSSFGEEGVKVLIRGLERERRPGRAYRKLHRSLPTLVQRWLPQPQPDSTRGVRAAIVALLGRLGDNARSAVPAVIWTANHDEAAEVRLFAISYFNTAAGDNSLVNQLPPEQKRELFPALVRAIQDKSNPALRHNSAIGIKYFPEQRNVLAPVLIKAMQDTDSYVRLYAAEGLNRVEPAAAEQHGATALLAAFAKSTDLGLAVKAVSVLAHSGSQPAIAVPVLVQCLASTNTTITCEAIWALEWAPKEFHAHSNSVIPALTTASERGGSVGGYARVALGRWTSKQ